MNIRETLTKENFWDRMMELYPNATKKFCQWIDEYKIAVGWNALFGENVKFHDLPGAMQVGIWLEYVCDRGGCTFEIENFFEYDLGEDIEGFFKEILEGEAKDDFESEKESI